MYKLHYDVDAGKQLNVVYEGVEFEVQAGTGGGSDAEVETNKIVQLTTNGIHVIEPSIDKDAMAKVTATVNVPTANIEEEKYVELTEPNDMVEVLPSSGYDAMAVVYVSPPYVPRPEEDREYSVSLVPGEYIILPSEYYNSMSKVTLHLNVPWGFTFWHKSWFDGAYHNIIDLSGGGEYIFFSNEEYYLTYTPSLHLHDDTLTIVKRGNPEMQNDFPQTTLDVFSYVHPYKKMDFEGKVILRSGDQSAYPILEFIARDKLSIQNSSMGGSALIIGTRSSTHARYEVYGEFQMYTNLVLNGADLYLYTNNIRIFSYSITNGVDTSGTIHVLTTFSGFALGGHDVIKDLTLPTN